MLAASLLVLPVACGGGAGPAHPASVLTTWFEQTNAAVQAQGPPPDPVAARTWALAWWAADRATAGRDEGPYADAAVASAVHDVLVALVPQRRRDLDRALGTPADSAGAAAGQEAAARTLHERAADGLSLPEVERPGRVPVEAAGTWRPTAPGFPPPAEAGLPDANPFLLTGAAQLRPPPPPRPGTSTYRQDLAEVRELGQDSSAARTPDQTAVAQFWSGSELDVQVRLLRAAMREGRVRTVQGVRLLSAFHRITADAEIAVFDAKYTYLLWRPITALRVDGDGDPATPLIEGWAPLIPTPGHPEYPSAHTAYAAAAAAVLAHFLGPQPPGPLVVDSVGLPGVRRSYLTWQQAVTENEDARVWSGIHYRTSDDVGSELGRAVAAYGLTKIG